LLPSVESIRGFAHAASFAAARRCIRFLVVIFLPILAKNWLPLQRPLDPCNQKCRLWIDQPRKSLL